MIISYDIIIDVPYRVGGSSLQFEIVGKTILESNQKA